MSTLTLHIGRSIGATLEPGDEIVVTTLDHEANVSTWRAMAADRGVTVQTVDIDPSDVTLDLEDLESKLGPRTKLVAVGYASNAVGTINPVSEIVARAHEVGALTYVDAVAYAPHGPIDVRDLDTDFLACSAYKWFGPHLGVLYGKAEILDRLPASRCARPTTGSRPGPRRSNRSPGRWRRPTTCATSGASYGDVTGAPGAASGSERRRELVAAMVAIAGYERELVARLIDGLERIAGVTIHGITERARFAARVPTVSVSIDGRPAAQRPPRRSAGPGIYAWDGDFYATGLIERLGKAESGGVLRLGLVHYNTAAEVDRTLDELERIAGRADERRRAIDPRAGWPGRSTPPSCAGSSDCGCATRSPRTRAISTAWSPRSRPTASTRSSRPASAGRGTPARGRSTGAVRGVSRTTPSRCPRS